MYRRLGILLCLVVMLGVVNGASAALIAHWPLDGDAQDVVDGHHGILVGGAAFVEDADRGIVLSVDGVDGHVAVPHAEDMEFAASDSYTIAAWAYIEAVTGTWQAIMAQSREQGDHYGIWVTDAGDWMGGGWENRGSKVPLKVWVHVAYAQNGATGTAATYVNGVADWTGGTRNGTGLGDFWIGGAQLPAPYGPPHEMFGGMIDDVRVYDHALTAAEVKALIPPKLKAYSPQPPDGATGITLALLQWTKGETARFHKVYLGTSPELTEADLVSPPLWTQPMHYHAAGLDAGVTYYWRVDEVEADNKTIHTGRVWSFTTAYLTAYTPVPADGSRGVTPAPVLGWAIGQNAVEHHLYFGDSLDAVQQGTAETDQGIVAETSFSTGLLRAGTTYYWRVDEIDALNQTRVGNVWSFTTRDPVQGKIVREWWSIIDGTVVSNLTDDPRYPSDPSGSELLNLFEGPVDWADNYGSRLSGWLVPPTSGEYTFWIASDDGGELRLSTDADPNNATMIAGVVGWTGPREWDNTPAQKSGAITLQAGQKYYLEALQKEGGGGDNVAVAWQPPGGARDVIAGEFVHTYALPPVKAATPFPADGAVDTVQSPILSWFAGEKAQQHQVYLGQNADAVANADASSADVYQGQQAGTTFDPGALEWGKTYYWRIDESNTGDPASPWIGTVWSFTTADFLLVEDFESYTDNYEANEAIFQTWIDGMENGTASIVGYFQAPFAETRIFHGGGQSMPLDYNNVNATYYSQAERTFTPALNMTVNGMDTLTLYIRGQSSNDMEPLYIGLESGATRVNVLVPDAGIVQSGSWIEVNVPLADFTGVNAAAVKKMYISLGNPDAPVAGGAGLVYVDDIRATSSALR